jgi:hypothetical protein
VLDELSKDKTQLQTVLELLQDNNEEQNEA